MLALSNPLVGLVDLASAVEQRHFPDLTSTREVVPPETTGMSSSAPLISDMCSHVSIISDTDSTVNTTSDVQWKPSSQMSPVTTGEIVVTL